MVDAPNTSHPSLCNIEVPWRSVLLGEDISGVDLRNLRLEQVREARSRKSLPIAAAVLVAACYAYISVMSGHPWLAPVVALLPIAVSLGRYWSSAERARVYVEDPVAVHRKEFAMGVASGAAMGLPVLILALLAGTRSAELAWMALGTGMLVYALAAATVPLMFVAYMPAAAVVAAVGLGIVFSPVGLAAATVVPLVCSAAILANGRQLIISELCGREAEERGETVSLLLKEFEDTGADWLWTLDHQRRITRPSPRFAHALARDADDLQGASFLQMLAGEAWETGKFPAVLHDLANRLNRREAFSNLMVPVVVGGRQRHWELSASPTFEAEGRFTGFRGVGSDVTEQRESADRIEHLARFDGLTGLPNRLYINETLAGALEQATAWRRTCAFLMIDLDRFKAVNDTLGHPIGDRLLAQVAARVKGLCSENLVAGRLGGDEFAVVLREVEGVDAAEQVGRRLVEIISRPYEIDQHTLYVGASVGYAFGPRDGSTVEAIIRNADLALYRSKDRGGGTVHGYEPTLHDQARERREIEIELRQALGRNEFEVHFQPVVCADGRIDGFEALLRWTSHKLGAVSPIKFIPVAEDTRLIGPIGEWVLQSACREAARWPAPAKVAVNVSAEQLAQPNFSQSVVKALSYSGLAPSRLELEVTESVFLREVSGAMATLDQIRALGVKLVLDDFGTGYSSLGYLRMGQFSTIKVDRSFVKGALAGNRESIAIIRAVVALAESLEMSTTAEGVETREEAEAIVRLGCAKLQGYYYGRPMPASDAAAVFESLQRATA